jgi:ABC-type lipoprotein export system ATPase subunit
VRLKIDQVSKSFGERAVLSGVSFECESGETIALMGPSGSGKSTLLGIIAREIDPDAGSVTATLDEGPEVTRRLHWIYQSAPLLLGRSTVDNVMLTALANGAIFQAAEERALRALDEVGLADHADSKASSLSGGQQQRVAIARALIADSRLVLADEPTAALDRHNRDLVSESLQALARAGAIVVVATHDHVVADQCSRVVNLEMIGTSA